MRATMIIWRSNGIYQRPQTPPWLSIWVFIVFVFCVCVRLCLFIWSPSCLCIWIFNIFVFSFGANEDLGYLEWVGMCIWKLASTTLSPFSIYIIFQSFWSEGSRRRTNSFLKTYSCLLNAICRRKPHTFFEWKKKSSKILINT